MPVSAKPSIRQATKCPAWFDGDEQIDIVPTDFCQQLTLANENATVTIHPIIDPDTNNVDNWMVIYGVQSNDRRDYIFGSIYITPPELIRAFGLDPSLPIPPEDHDFVTDYQGCQGRSGHFLRYDNCLNIPNPGTGHPGDCNVSIYLTPAIQDAVRDLILRNNAPSPLKLVC